MKFFVKFGKLYATVGIVVVLGAAGGWYANHLITERVGNQVVTMLTDPSVQNEIAGLGNSVNIGGTSSVNSAPSNSSTTSQKSGAARGSQGVKSTTSASSENGNSSDANPSGSSGSATSSPIAQPTSSPGVPQFTSRQQLIQFAMSRFTKQQIASYLKMYMNRSSLSEQQKASIKAQILSHFTPAEIRAMEVAAKKYQ